MKTIGHLILIISISFTFTSCNQNKVLSPVDYHDKIITIYNNTDNLIVEFVKNVYDKEATVEDLQNSYDLSLDNIKKSLDELNSIKKLEDDPGFIDAVIDFHSFCDVVIKEDFKEIIDIYSEKNWTDEKGHKIDKTMAELFDKIIEKEGKVIEIEETYALKYGIVLPEN